jgi:hypothetical protein
VPAEPLPRPADPTIEQVFQAFVAEQRTRLKPATADRYESVLSLLQSHLDRYAYEGLSKAERALFERHFNAEGEQQRGFCQLFGPDKLPENLGTFFSYFLPNKVLGGPNLSRMAATVTRKLLAWLATQAYIDAQAAREGSEQAAAAGKVLPRAEKAAMALDGSIRRLPVHPNDLPDEDWIEFDHHRIARIEPGRLWLHVYREGGEQVEVGPISAPREATELLAQGWEIGCSLARFKGQWQIVELGNVRP